MTLNTIEMASHNGTSISLAEVMATLKASGDFSVVETALCQVIAKNYASENGISVSVGELQASADEFRQNAGLQKSDDMHQWLEETGQSLDDFEDSLEYSILGSKLRDHIASDSEVERLFLAERSNLEQVELAQLCTESDEQAQEIFAQISDDELSFEEAVAAYELDATSKRQNGYIGWLALANLPQEVRTQIRNASPSDIIGPMVYEGTPCIFKIWAKDEPTLDDAVRDDLADAIYADWLATRFDEANINIKLTS